MNEEVQVLFEELLRQKVVVEAEANGGDTPLGVDNTAHILIDLKTQDVNYSIHLQEIRARIQSCMRDRLGTLWETLLLPDPSLLWKILAFSRLSFCFVDPYCMRERLEAFLNVLARADSSVISPNYTRDIWADQTLRRWVTSTEPLIISLETSIPRTQRLERFGLELISHIEQYNPVIIMLSGLPPSVEGNFFASLTPEMVIEQLIVQALRFVPVEKPLAFLSKNMPSFKEPRNCQGLFNLLMNVCKIIPKLTIVLDIRILSPRFEDVTKCWPLEFQRIMNALWEAQSSCLKVMFLRRKGQNSDIGGVLSIEGAKPTESKLASLQPFERPIPPPPYTATKSSEESETLPGSAIPTSAENANVGTQEASSIYSFNSNLSSKTANIEQPDIDSPTPNSESNDKQQSWTLLENRVRELPFEDRANVIDLYQDIGDPLTHPEQIKVAILCALPLEADAVQALFDIHCDGIEIDKMRALDDSNAYSFGIIGNHHIVLVHMPGMGKGSGAIVATNCRRSFPNVKLALVVGICGGVPFYEKGKLEIILGDVVISEGLVGHDFGRQFPDRFVRKAAISDNFGKPPAGIRSLLNKLKGRLGRRRLEEKAYEHLQTLRQELGDSVKYPGAAEDMAFQGAYRHKHNDANACTVCSPSGSSSDIVCDKARSSTCEELSCDKTKLVARRRLDAVLNVTALGSSGPSPAVHFGYVASGDQVMKSGEHRDNIAKEEGVIAFEMEAAGVWDTFPCLVIKGVCDYADSHKSKVWQDYAAATGACYAKAFLQEWRVYS